MARFSIMAAGGGSVRSRGCPVYHGTYLKPSYLEFREISSDTPIAWAVGDYVDYTRTGLRYTLYDLPEMAQNSEKQKVGERYVYSNVRFYARTKDLERCLFRDIVTADNTVHFSSRKTISTFEDVDGLAARIQACLDSGYPGEWSVVLDTDLKTSVTSVSEAREFSIESGSSVLDALDRIYSVWENVGWTYSYNSTTGKNILSIGGANTKRAGNTVAGGSIGKGSGLTSVKVTFSRLDDMCTRLYPFGSSRNMRARYYNSLNIKDAESVDIPNLMIPVSSWGKTDSLPDPKKAFIRVASVRDERLLGVRPKVLYFDDEEYGEIYPSIEGVTIGDVRESMETTDNYYPSTSIYTDSERADEVKSSKTANLDDGTSGVKEITQTVDPECDASMTGSVGVNGSVTLTKNIGFASLRMGRWSDIILADGQADIYVEMDNGVSLDEAFLTVTNMGNEAKVDLLRNYDSTTGKTRLSIPDDCVLLHEDFFKVSDTNYGNTFILELHLTVTASRSKSLQSSSVTVDQDNSAPISISLRDGHPASAYVTLKQIGFDPNLQRLSANDKVGTLEMKTGACAGRSFRIDKCSYDSSADGWNLKIRRVVDRSMNMTFPNSTYPIAAGDRFVLTDIKMPDEYIEYASQRLLSRAEEVLDELSHPIAVLTPSMDAKFIKENARSFIEGQFLSFEAPLLSQGYMALGYYSDLIDTLTINENEANIPTYSLTLRERPRKSFKLPSDSSASNTEDVESGDSSGSGSSSSAAKGDKGEKGDDGVGIKSVTQTTTSTADRGENVVTVELTDGSSSQFKFRNGSKGSPGAAAGFGSVTATAVPVAYGTAPSVDVTTSGPDTAINISFEFKIPRGASGGGSAIVMTYPDFVNMKDKDEGTLYAVTYNGRCDLYLGNIRITGNITEILPTGIVIIGPDNVSVSGNTAQFQVTYSPSNTTQRSITWSVVSGSDYASIDEKGLLTVKEGANGSTVKIRATSKDNSSVYAEKSVTVTYKIASVSVTGVSLSKSVLSLAVGESETLVATVAPERATDRSVTWESSNKNVATVNQNGTVKAVAAGSAVIGVRTNDGGFTARCNLTVAAVVNEYTLTVNCATPGATVKVLEYVAGQSSMADAVTYTEPMTFRENTTVKVWAYKNGMIDSGMQTIVMDSNKTATVACKTIPTWNLESEMSAEAAGLSIPYEVSDPDSVGWRLESDADWIAVDSDAAIDVNTNPSSSSRTGHVSLICDAVETNYVVATCTVMQAAGASSELTPSISFLQDTFSVPATTTSVTQLFSSKNLTGLTATVTGALEGATVNLNEVSKTIVVNFGANTAATERTGKVTVTGTRTDGQGTYSKSFTIVQAAAKTAATWDLPATLAFEAGGDGVVFNITDKDSAGWRLTLPDWCFVSDGITEGSGDHETNIVARANYTGSARTGHITLYPAGSSTMTMRCEVSQEEDTTIEQE